MKISPGGSARIWEVSGLRMFPVWSVCYDSFLRHVYASAEREQCLLWTSVRNIKEQTKGFG